MQNFQEFAKEQELESQYPNWRNCKRDTLRWKDKTQPTRYAKFVKKEMNKDTALEQLKFVEILQTNQIGKLTCRVRIP
jgi:hypothetical protein